MNPRLRTGRPFAVLLGLLTAVGAYAAHPSVALAVFTGVFWTATGLLARRNWEVVRRRGSRWAGAHGALSSLAVLGQFAVVTSLSLPVGLGFALGLFVLGVANAATGVGVEMANEGDGGGGREREHVTGGASGGDASAVRDGDDGAAASR